jgi:hypothetical protein
MIKDEMRRLLAEDPGHVYYSWFGSIYTDTDQFSRLDKTYMYCLYMKDGVSHYDRIIGFPTRSEDEERIKFTTDISYRVTSGRRRGWIMEERDLEDDELFVVAGIHKNLDDESGGASMHLSNPSDKMMLMLLPSIIRGEVIECDDLAHPSFWLSTTGYPPRLRSDRMALNYIKGFARYDHTRTPDDNVFRLQDDIVADAGLTPGGKRRLAYPYKYFVGKGVRVASLDLTNQWYRTPVSGMNFENRELICKVGEYDGV